MGFLLYLKGLKNGLTAICLKFNKEKCKRLQIHENNCKIQGERIWIQWCEEYGMVGYGEVWHHMKKNNAKVSTDLPAQYELVMWDGS